MADWRLPLPDFTNLPCQHACSLAAAIVVVFGRLAPLADNDRDTLWLCALVVTATPTANNLIVMCDVAGQNKSAMGTTIFTQYMLAPLLLPPIITAFVIIVSSA